MGVGSPRDHVNIEDGDEDGVEDGGDNVDVGGDGIQHHSI